MSEDEHDTVRVKVAAAYGLSALRRSYVTATLVDDNGDDIGGPVLCTLKRRKVVVQHGHCVIVPRKGAVGCRFTGHVARSIRSDVTLGSVVVPLAAERSTLEWAEIRKNGSGRPARQKSAPNVCMTEDTVPSSLTDSLTISLPDTDTACSFESDTAEGTAGLMTSLTEVVARGSVVEEHDVEDELEFTDDTSSSSSATLEESDSGSKLDTIEAETSGMYVLVSAERVSLPPRESFLEVEVNPLPGVCFRMGKMTVDFAVKVHSRIKAHLVVRFGDQMLRAQLMSNLQVSGSDVGDITNGVCSVRMSFALFDEHFPAELAVTFVQESKIRNTRRNDAVELPTQEDVELAGGMLTRSKSISVKEADLDITMTYTTHAAPCSYNVVTEKFSELMSDDDGTEQLLSKYGDELSQLHVLLVGGLFTNHYPGYFSGNVSCLQKLGVRLERVKINSDAPCAFNAEIIKEAVQNANSEVVRIGHKKKVLLIAHSKGCADIHTMFSMFPDVVEYVCGCIMMQGVYHGSGIVELISATAVSNAATLLLPKLFKDADWKAVENIGYAERIMAIEQTPYPASVPTVALASKFKFDTVRSLSDLVAQSMRSFASLVSQHTGFDSDGMVVPYDAIFPDCDLVLVGGITHAEPANVVPGSKFLPATLTRVLLYLWIEKYHRTVGL